MPMLMQTDETNSKDDSANTKQAKMGMNLLLIDLLRFDLSQVKAVT